MEEFLRRLKTGLEGLVLHSHLHLLYLVTPAEFSASIPLAPDIFFQRYSALNFEDLAAAEQIGATECMVMLMASGRSLGSDAKALLHHFYLTLILYDLWKQNSIWYVAQKYQVHRGIVQNLLNSASALGATLNNFCQELSEFWAYQQLLPNFVKQLSYCVTMELLPLMELPAVKRGRARQLYVAGFKSLADIAKVDPRELVAKVHHLPYKTANQIVSAAKMILLEKADALKEE
ncbi:Helicase POLQ-like protein, partial [Stegodyphus mimosarum]